MKNQLKPYWEKLQKMKGQEEWILAGIDACESNIKHHAKELKKAEEAKLLFQQVAMDTQKQIEFHISDMVSNALAVVFDVPYKFVVKFVEKRGKTECELLFERDGMEVNPLSSAGYGYADVAAFALRVASWQMLGNIRPVLLLDEPFKHLKGNEANKKAIRMVQQLSKELKLQIIMVSDERAPREDIADGSDKLFEISLKKGKSKVKLLETV